MAHPLMFRDDDPVLIRLRGVALALPGAAEKISHGRPTFFTTKVFAMYGGSVRLDGAWIRHDSALMVLPDPDEAAALRQDPRCFVPAYLGPRGWIGLDLDGDTDWDEVAELVESSYRRTAGKRLIAALDAETDAR